MTPDSGGSAATFDLEIELGGICLFLWDEGGTFVDVIMPDARHPREKPARATHHAGYVRFDLANLEPAVPTVPPADPEAGPYFEAVHRFDREELRLGLADDGSRIDRTALKVPNFDEFAPILEPLPALRQGQSPDGVLMRLRLHNGSFSHLTGLENWRIDGTLNNGEPKEMVATGDVLWKRKVSGDALGLSLVRFAGGRRVDIPLRPAAGSSTIRLKVANLCENPLEWGELTPPGEFQIGHPDDDFRWLYRLMQVKPGKTGPAKDEYPVPKRINKGMLQPCLPAQAS